MHVQAWDVFIGVTLCQVSLESAKVQLWCERIVAVEVIKQVVVVVCGCIGEELEILIVRIHQIVQWVAARGAGILQALLIRRDTGKIRGWGQMALRSGDIHSSRVGSLDIRSLGSGVA